MSQTPAIAIAVEVRVVLELANAAEMDSGMCRVATLLRRAYGAASVEWWSADDGALRFVGADGDGGGERREFPLRPAGVVVVVGRCDPRLASALAIVAPVVRRRAIEAQLTDATIRLARRNETLEDFAALVAHELKAPLQAALVADDAARSLQQALGLVDSLIEAAHDPREPTSASTALCLDEVLRDLGALGVEVTAEVTVSLPLPPVSLRVILGNLLRNAVAARAGRVHVAAARSHGSSWLVVDDDGVGIAEAGDYAAGSGLGLNLCRRIAGRYGGVLELAPRAAGGTRATLELAS